MAMLAGTMLVLAAVTFGAFAEKRCFAPVLCSKGNVSTNDWLQLFPQLTCHASQNDRKCFAPVTCSDDEVSTNQWLQISPQLPCPVIDSRNSSCKTIQQHDNDSESELYDLKDSNGSIYRTYCDMSIDGGGWTLVASVHENNITGKCTAGDRWSSERGNSAEHPHGDGAWENTVIFGAPELAASDDYKNQGYFNIAARDVMIWHVPNNASLNEFKTRAFMMYHTNSSFLWKFGKNLRNLFKDYYPLRDRAYNMDSGNGPAPPIVWDRGSNDIMVLNTPPNNRVETTPGYIQFRAINYERGAFAICPGVKIKPGHGNVEHVCIGGTSNHGQSYLLCGDFAAKDGSGYGTGTEWSANLRMTESVVMIFYR